MEGGPVRIGVFASGYLIPEEAFCASKDEMVAATSLSYLMI
jgi:hypothetical protein